MAIAKSAFARYFGVALPDPFADSSASLGVPCCYPQLPPGLRTLAVPPFGVQVGSAVSLPIATPPFVAVAVTGVPVVVHVADAWALRLAFAVALQNPVAVAVAVLPCEAFAVAVATIPALAVAVLALVAFAVAWQS